MEKAVLKITVLDHLIKKRSLALIMASICIVILSANLMGRETAILVGNLLYTPVTVFMAISSYVLLRKQRKMEDDDRGWILFFAAATIWLLAEHTWMVTELVLHSKTFPSAADFFYIGGYALMGTFIYRMMWPLKKFISFDIKMVATLIVSVFLVPTVLTAYGGGNTDSLSLILSLAYPVMDGILLWPGIIVLASSFRFESGKFWTLVSSGIISLLIGDTVFSYANLIDAYYTGYPFEIFFYAAYIMFGFAALTRVRQALVHAPLLEEVREAFQGNPVKSLFSKWKILAIFSTSIVITFLILEFEKGIVERLTTNELSVITPAGYVLSGLMAAIIAFTLITVKNIHKLQLKINKMQKPPHGEITPTDTEILVNTFKQSIKKQEQRQTVMLPLWTAVIVAFVVVSTYALTSSISEMEKENALIQSGRYLIQNLQGSTIDTWVAWNVPVGQPLQVTIVNSNLVGSDKLQAVKDAILSRDLTVVKDAKTGQEQPESTVYFDGWQGAVESIHQQNSSMPVPINFEISQSDKAVGDIIIILSTDADSDGSLAFTKSIADASNHQLLKSFITIFDVRNLTVKKIGDVTRHEFGHALGLGHSSDPRDLMNKQFHEDLAYISPCDVSALKSIYSDHQSAEFTCTGAR